MTNKYTAYRFIDDTHKECSLCGLIKPHSEFHKDRNIRNRNLAYYCKDCANAKGRMHHTRRQAEDANYKLEKKRSYVKTRHKISLEEYQARIDEQDSKCYICEVSFKNKGKYFAHLDHDHETGYLRHFLCTNCNRGLGHFQDSPKILQRALEYLVMHKENARTLEEGFSP